MKKLSLLTLIFMLIFPIWGRGGVDAEAEALDIATLTEGQYIPYTVADWAQNQDKKRVLFFHAAWCPTCRAAQVGILENYTLFSPDTVVFKIDYDNSKELKRTYNVTQQHTFVITDEDDNAIAKWYGGDAERIAEEIGKF